MRPGGLRLYAGALAWTLSCAGGGYLFLDLWIRGEALLGRLPEMAALLVPALLAAHLASRRREPHLPRLALAFVVAALLLLPPPGALLIAALACLGGLGAGVLGPRRGGTAAFAVTVVVVAVAQFLDPFPGLEGWPQAGAALGGAALVFVFVQAFALALTLLLSGGADPTTGDATPPAWRALALESAAVPLGWMLAETLARRAWIESCVISAIVLGGEVTLLALSRTLGALRNSNRSLALRIGELDTLHAIGREILSSLEPGRVCAIVERECRKIFPLDYCLIALSDVENSRLQAVYRRERGRPALTEELPLRGGLTGRVAEEKRPLRIDDAEEADLEDLLRLDRDFPALRSAMAVPLIVEERVIGVLALLSREPAAYEDHQVAVLTTVAQQAAVAIENARSYQMATVDSLTGFFLRDHFFKRLEEEHRRVGRYGGTFSLLMMDLDGFKEINDRHGHLAGDQYLRGVAATIRRELRAADLACRYGGDEFCLLLPETELRGASAIAERIRVAVAREIVGVEGVALRTTASIGVAVYPRHGAADVAGLLRHADEALYRAKRAGRDCVVPYAA